MRASVARNAEYRQQRPVQAIGDSVLASAPPYDPLPRRSSQYIDQIAGQVCTTTVSEAHACHDRAWPQGLLIGPQFAFPNVAGSHVECFAKATDRERHARRQVLRPRQSGGYRGSTSWTPCSSGMITGVRGLSLQLTISRTPWADTGIGW